MYLWSVRDRKRERGSLLLHREVALVAALESADSLSSRLAHAGVMRVRLISSPLLRRMLA